MKRPLKLALGATAVLGLAFVGLLGALALLFPPARVKAIVLEKAGEALHREVRLEGASLRVFPFLGVSLKGFEVANNPDSGFSADPLLHLASLDVKLSTMSLFRMAPVVNGIVLDEPRIRVEILPDGRTSLDGLGGPADTTAPVAKDSVKPIKLPFPLSVERVAIVNGSVEWLDRKEGREVRLGDIDQEVSLTTDASLENVDTKGRLELKDVSVSGTGLPVRKGGIRVFVEHDIHLNLPGAVVEIASLKFGVQDLAMELTGKATNILVAPSVDVRLRSSTPIDLGKLLAEVPREISPELEKLSLSGRFDMDLTAVGGVVAGAIPVVNGAIHLVDVGASAAGVPAKLEKLGVAVHIRNTTTIEIDSTSWLLNGDAGHLLLAVDSLPLGADSSRKPVLRQLDAKGSVDLAALAQVAAPLIPVLDTLDPKGRVFWEILAHGLLDPANPMGLSVAGSVKLQGVEASVPSGKDRVKVDGTVDITNSAAKLALAIVSGPTDLAVTGSAVDWLALALPKLSAGRVAKIDVGVKSKVIDLDRFLPPVDTTAQAKPAAPLELPALPPVTLHATFDAGLIKAMGLSLVGTQGKLALVDGKLSESVAAGIAQGRMKQDLSADLSNPKRLSARFNADLAGVKIHDLLIGIKDRIPAGPAKEFHDKIFGTGNIHVVGGLEGSPAPLMDVLSADLDMDLKDGKLAGVPAAQKLGGGLKKVWSGAPTFDPLEFASLVMTAQLRSGRIEIKDLQIDGAEVGMIQVKGFLEKDQTVDLKVDTHMPEASSGFFQGGAGMVASATSGAASALGLSVGSALPQDERNRVVLSWLVTGPLASPQVRPDATALTAGAKNAADAMAASLRKKADEETAKVKAAAEAAKAEAEAKARAAVDAKKNEVKNKAQDAIKGKLKGFGL